MGEPGQTSLSECKEKGRGSLSSTGDEEDIAKNKRGGMNSGEVNSLGD